MTTVDTAQNRATIGDELLPSDQKVELAMIEEKMADPDVEGQPGQFVSNRKWQFSDLYKRSDMINFYREALEKYGNDEALTPEMDRAVRRKIDMIVLPCLGICYLFYYVDKTTLSYAAIFGIKDHKIGLGLSGSKYSWLSSIFYFGWLAWSIPSNLIMQKVPFVSYLSINIMLWGVFLMAQAAAKNFAELAVLRVLSGAFESIADPAFMLITTMWYKSSEQPSRISAWYAFNGVGVGAGGLIGYGIGHIKGSLASWRYEFLIVGAVCSAWALALIILIPNTHASAWWLTREERLIAVARIRHNQTGTTDRTWKMDQIRECLTDVKTWLFFFIGFLGAIPNGGISNFSTLVIQGLGFDRLHTSLLGLPQGALVVIWIAAGAILNSKLPPNNRTTVCMLFMLPTIAGTLGFLLAPTNAYVGRLICFYLTGSYQTSFVICLSLITSNTAGQTKKMLTNAMIWFGSCIGSIASPFFYKAEQAPTYKEGIGSMLASNILEALCFLALRIYLKRLNRQRESQRQEEAPAINETAFADLTDKQNLNFHYVY
ncbi:hypothetical protein L486_05319 [Kwoniella mangroviensis CBS 10435]|uniref:Major facilitator superfamily (MFS) profile domain-containing protein n=1 Tax=Kwoniella mangroviensis CBS 10435 TaxID=1331196 RepID=A0A1B9IR15_9TREE|nr:uncharacterized protein I203_08428 [Kwoniella mangroviensis CBS 8507]OCF57854.1 hypothetical protein L486_05319 [Kwoniella mangroviensis CBS 10435]OCF62504.1 hypothetical protein I203_08428 [Kwoniella mangroviensis CBS 8507]